MSLTLQRFKNQPYRMLVRLITLWHLKQIYLDRVQHYQNWQKSTPGNY